MPILIKSSGRQRTCRIMTNDTRGDIIEALKGLTFKFEVKIVDVVRTSSAEDTSHSIEATNSKATEPVKAVVETNHSDGRSNHTGTQATPVEAQPAKVLVDAEPIQESKRNEFDSRINYEDEPRTELLSAPNHTLKRAEELPKKTVEPETEVKPPTGESNAPKAPTFVPSILTKKHGLLDKPKQPKIVRGELINKQDTCCITVESYDHPAVAFIAYDNRTLLELTQKIAELTPDIRAQPEVRSVEVGDIVFAKSQDDDSWYRAIITQTFGPKSVKVNFFDWGLNEKLDLDRIRRMNQLELGFAKYPACAVKVRFTNQPGELLDEALKCESEISIEVNSYDSMEEIYTVTILGLA